MAEKIIRSHRQRVKAAKDLIPSNPIYRGERISIVDREAFVEFFLLEDIRRLYQMRLKREKDRGAVGGSKRERQEHRKVFSYY